MNQQFSPDFKALDFIQGLIEKFNLVVEPEPDGKNLLSIEPYDTWVNQATVVDWTNKVDRDTNFEISHPAIEQPRVIIFSDEDDDDYLNEYTRQTFGRTYGQYVFTADSDLPEGERRIGKVFAPTPTTNIPNSTAFIIPHLCTKTIGSSEAYRPIAFKPRLLYGIGVQTVESTAAGFSGSAGSTGSYFLRNENGITTQQNQWYQVSSLSEMPISGQAYDLHFNNNNQGAGAIPPYWSNVVPNGANFISGSGDAFTTYWANYINGLYDVDARKLTCNVYLAPNEIPSIRLNQKVFIDGQYYRINKINGANLTRRDTIEVELIKTIARQLTFPRRRIVANAGDSPRDVQFQGYNPNGTGRYVDFNTGDEVNDYATVSQAGPLDGLRVYRSGTAGETGSVVWNYEAPTIPALQQSIIGTNNVAVDSSKVTVLGSKNNVGNTVSTAQIMGQYNTVESNVTNAFILGQQNIIGETAVNTQILGGVGNYTSGSNNNLTIVGGTGSYAVNTDYSAIINGYNAGLRDSDVTTLINQHENEVVINGSGHTVIGLNLEGAGLDLLNYRNNSNWLGDTYFGEAQFIVPQTLNLGDGTTISLTGSLQGQGRHESLYILNWNGLAPGTASIELPSYVNNDYTNIVYTFKANGTFDGTTYLELLPFGAQTIEGNPSYAFSGSNEYVQLIATSTDWLVLNAPKGAAGAPGPSGSTVNIYNSNGTLTANRTVTLGGNDLSFIANTGETFKVSSSAGSSVEITGLPQITGSNIVYYNSASGQLSYGAAPSGSGGSGSAFPYTGSAQITGSLGVTGSVIIDSPNEPQLILTGSNNVNTSLVIDNALLVKSKYLPTLNVTSVANSISGIVEPTLYFQYDIGGGPERLTSLSGETGSNGIVTTLKSGLLGDGAIKLEASSLQVPNLTEGWTALSVYYNPTSDELTWSRTVTAETLTSLPIGGTRGQLAVSGSVGSSSFYVGNGGANWDRVLTVSQTQDILTLAPINPLPTTGVKTGSFAVSGSTPPKPYFWDGSTWNALY